jgi:hypothetical protein
MNEVAVSPESTFVRPADIPRTCSDEDLRLGVSLWMHGFDADAVALRLGISREMVGGWTQKRGWKEIVARLDEAKTADDYVAMGRILSLTYAALEDRVRNGDLVEVTTWDDQGVPTVRTSRRPIPAWQLSNIGDKLGHRRMLTRDRAGGLRTVDPDALGFRELAAALEHIARRKPENMKTIDADGSVAS